MNDRAWLALWTVYVVWGSTYLGIELAGETVERSAHNRRTTGTPHLLTFAGGPTRRGTRKT